MVKTRKTKIRANGVTVLLSGHPEVRRLKAYNIPSNHGNRFWTSSWLLMDYFKRRGLPKGTRVMEVGCGWGLSGIYCAKKHGAAVTGVDIDPDVFPFLHLHAEVNEVKVATMRKGFNDLRIRHLKDFNVMMGADICFWDDMMDPLRKLIGRALRAGVELVLIADPGRSPFLELGEYFNEKGIGEILDWTVHRPRRIQGQILRISMEKIGAK